MEPYDKKTAELIERSYQTPEIVNQRLRTLAALALADGESVLDAVSCTQTLLYVEDMDQALREIHRVLKPRGRIAIIETDWNGAIINSLDQAMTDKIFDAWGLAVVNLKLPRRLGAILRRIGFGAQRVEAIPVLNASYSEHSFSANMLQNFADAAVKQNLITVAESRSWREGVDSLIQRDEYFFCVNRFLFSAVK